MQNIMIVEDDPSAREELALLLENEGYGVLSVVEFTEIATQAEAFGPDLILLDIGLPGRDGFSLCAELRKAMNVPVIFVTSRDCGPDEVRALSLGGDDYITKPYQVGVLLARIKAVLRRGGGTKAPEVLQAMGLRLNLVRGTVSTGKGTMPLTRNELQILATLMECAGEIVSRGSLMDTLWDNQIYIDDNTLSVNVNRLRGKLAKLGEPERIKTRRGMGYQL